METAAVSGISGDFGYINIGYIDGVYKISVRGLSVFGSVNNLIVVLTYQFSQWQHHGGTGGLFHPLNLKSRQKLSKKNGIKLIGYTFRLKNYVFRAGAATEFT